MVRLKLPVAVVEATASVSMEDALPPADGVTLMGENVAVTPLGKLVILKLVAALNPFTLPTVTVLLPLLPWMMLNDAGAVRLKSGGGVPTVSVRVVVWLEFPANPVIVTGDVPAAAVEEAEMVRVDDAVPPDARVTLAGDKLALTPLGKPLADRLMLPLNPPRLLIITVVLPLPEGRRLREAGDTLRLKSGAGGGGVLIVRFKVMLWLRLGLPDAPVIVSVNVPVAAVEAAETVSVEDALPPAAGATVPGESDAVTPLGVPETIRLVAEVKPFRLVTLMLDVPLAP